MTLWKAKQVPSIDHEKLVVGDDSGHLFNTNYVPVTLKGFASIHSFVSHNDPENSTKA